jgi:hypothetical protein
MLAFGQQSNTSFRLLGILVFRKFLYASNQTLVFDYQYLLPYKSQFFSEPPMVGSSEKTEYLDTGFCPFQLPL